MPPSPRPHATANQPPGTRGPRWGRWIFALLWGAAVAGGYAVYSGALTLPERFNPWAPLDVAAAPNVLTPFKLSRARSEPARCLAALALTGMRYNVQPDRVTGPGCGFENAVLLWEAGVRLGPPLSLSCPMALSFAMWERHTLQPAAQLHAGQRVTGITHLGSCACRNVNGGEGAQPNAPPGKRSRHATADAMDIAGFTLANGKNIAVMRQWQAQTRCFSRRRIAAPAATSKGCWGRTTTRRTATIFIWMTGGYSMCR